MVAAWTLVVLSEWAAAAKRARWHLDEIAPPARGRGRRNDRPVGHADRPGDGGRVRPRSGVEDDRDEAARRSGRRAGRRIRTCARPPRSAAAASAAASSPPRPEPPIPGRRELLAAVVAAALVAVPGTSALPDAHALRPAPALKPCCGLVAEVYATGLKRPTALAFGPDGLLYATQETGEVVAVGRGSSKPRVLARGFATPLGLAWVGSTLYVSAQGTSASSTCAAGRSCRGGRSSSRLPFDRHQQDTIALGPDGRLYLGSGSTCDVCTEKDRRSGAILSFRQDGGDLRSSRRGSATRSASSSPARRSTSPTTPATTSATRSRPRRS